MPRKRKSLKAKTDEERIFRIVLGSLKACILAHGPIDLNRLGSAAKRVSTSIYGAMNEGHLPMTQKTDELHGMESLLQYDLQHVYAKYDDETGNLVLTTGGREGW